MGGERRSGVGQRGGARCAVFSCVETAIHDHGAYAISACCTGAGASDTCSPGRAGPAEAGHDDDHCPITG